MKLSRSPRFARMVSLIGLTAAVMVGLAAPAQAATASSVTVYQKDRTVALRGAGLSCSNITYNAENSLTASYGGGEKVRRNAWFTCSGNGKTVAGDLYTHLTYRSDRTISVWYEMKLKVVQGSTVTNCGGSIKWFGDYFSLNGLSVQSTESKWWNQVWQQSADNGALRYVSCGAYGNVGTHYKLAEGLSAQ